MNNKDHKYNVELLSGLVLSLAACFMLFIYAPLVLYFQNEDEFWFDMYILFPVIFGNFIIVFLVNSLFFAGINRFNKIYKLCFLLYLIAFIASYVQGNFLVSSLPILDGSPIEWSQYPAARIKSIVLWLTVAIVIFGLYKHYGMKRMYKWGGVLGLFVMLMLGVTAIIICISSNGYEKKSSYTVTFKNLMEMSQEDNFIIFCLDAVSAETFDELLSEEPEYQTTLENFTYFNNTMGAYPFTKYSVPFILSGIWFENDSTTKEYQERVITSSPLFATLDQNEYHMGVYYPSLLRTDSIGRFENVLANKRRVNSIITFARWQVLLTGFQYAPFDLKRFSFLNPAALDSLQIPPDGYDIYTTANDKFYHYIQTHEISTISEKCFKYIHIDGGHIPYIYDRNVNIVSNGTHKDNVRSSMTIVKTYLEKLKKQNVYDNSVIIILSDHGWTEDSDLYGTGRQNPILCIKGRNEKHKMQVSSAPVSYVDLQTAYRRLLEGISSTNVFDIKEGEHRERRYLIYDYPTDGVTISEYVQTGNARDTSSLYPTGEEYEKFRVNKHIITEK